MVSGWYVVIKAANDFSCDEFPAGESFVFKSEDYVNGDVFRGQKFYDVQDMVIDRFGAESIEVKNINRVIDLVRGLLYGKNLPKARYGMAVELRSLRVSVGAAAAAVIADFLGDYGEHEGWTTIDFNSISDSVDRVVENSSAADSILQIRDISLYDLV